MVMENFKIKHNVNGNSGRLAADTTLFELWDSTIPFPQPENMEDPDTITQVSVTRAKKGEYHYLHEATIARHRNQFFVGWSNHKTHENGNRDELIRGCVSDDGIHWSEPETWVSTPFLGLTSFNHPLLFEYSGILYGFFVAWREERPFTEIFTFDDKERKWIHHPDHSLPDFVPFCTPQLMENGNWILGGESYWYHSAVAISSGDNMLNWKIIVLPESENIKLLYPETAIVCQKDRLLAVCRPRQIGSINADDALIAPVSESYDFGKNWNPIEMSNFPLGPSQPFAGTLSTGQNYLLTNSLEANRTLLSIAVTEPGGKLFKKIYKVRHQAWPAIRLFGGYEDGIKGSFVGMPTEWAYPGAIEYDEKLYIVYSQGKEDCAMSIIPVEALHV